MCSSDLDQHEIGDLERRVVITRNREAAARAAQIEPRALDAPGVAHVELDRAAERRRAYRSMQSE